MIFCSTYRWVPCSNFIREASSGSNLELVEKPTAKHYMGSPYEVSIGTPQKWRRKDCKSQREQRRPGKHNRLNQLSRAHMDSQRVQSQTWDLPWSIPGPVHLLWLFAWRFCETPTSGSRYVSESFPALRTAFLQP